MLLCVNSQPLIFSLYLSLSFPSCSHCFPSLSLFSSLPSPPCPYFFLLSLLTPSRSRLPSFPSLHLITLHTQRWCGQQAPAAVCVALHHGSACWRPPCLCLFFFSPLSPFPLSLSFPVLLQCSSTHSVPCSACLPQPPPRCPCLVCFVSRSASLGPLAHFQSLRLGLAPVGTFFSSPFFLYLPSSSHCSPLSSPHLQVYCEGQNDESRAGLLLTEVTSHCGGHRCAKNQGRKGSVSQRRYSE